MLQEIQKWINDRPMVKYAVSTIEGSVFGALGSYLIGYLNGTGTLTAAGLKRTVVAALVTGLTAVYNTWKTKPESKQ